MHSIHDFHDIHEIRRAKKKILLMGYLKVGGIIKHENIDV